MLFPRTTAALGSGDHKAMGLFIEQWGYQKEMRDDRTIFCEGPSCLCGEAFNVSTLRKVDLSIGAFPAYGYVVKGSEKLLDHAFGEWRFRLKKEAYEPSTSKPMSWSNQDLVEVCQEVFDSSGS